MASLPSINDGTSNTTKAIDISSFFGRKKSSKRGGGGGSRKQWVVTIAGEDGGEPKRKQRKKSEPNEHIESGVKTRQVAFATASATEFFGPEAKVLYGGFEVPADCEFTLLRLSVLNAFPQDRLVVFRERDHKYFVRGTMRQGSTTGFVHLFMEPFDSAEVAKRMVHGRNWANKVQTMAHYKACHVEGDTKTTIKNVLAYWERNRDRAAMAGTYNHQQIEWFYESHQYDKHGKSHALFRKFHDEYAVPRKLVPFRTEMLVHSCPLEGVDLFHMCGSIDMVYLADPADPRRVILFDWKFTIDLLTKHEKTMDSRYRKRCLAPYNQLWDTSLAPYVMQLNVYAWFLETFYGLEVVSAHLGVFHLKQHDFIVVDVPFLRKQTQSAMATRAARLKAGHVAAAAAHHAGDIPFQTFREGPAEILPSYEYVTEYARGKKTERQQQQASSNTFGNKQLLGIRKPKFI